MASTKESSMNMAHKILMPRSPPPPPGSSLSALVATLIPVLLVSGAMISAFLVLRTRFKRQYAPRTFLNGLRSQERTPELPGGRFNWLGAFNKIPDTYVLNHHSIDGYLLLRFLKISVAICFIGCCITWPILFPVTATGGGGNMQLDILTFGNVSPAKKNRYYAHALVSWVFFGFVFLMITREQIYFINLRQAYLLSPLYANRLSSRTVLFTSVPTAYLDEVKLRRMLGDKVKNLWIANDTKEVEDAVKERDKVAMKLEGAETKLILLANKNHLKAQKKGGAAATEGESHANQDVEAASGSIAAKYVPAKKRPSHRLKFLIGKKVDTIDWSRSELQTLIPKVDGLQNTLRSGQGKFVGSVFVEYVSQSAAQSAYQSLAHHTPLAMAPRFIGISPEEVIWKNLRIKWWERVVRRIATYSFVSALIVFWAIPVAVVASISNIDALTKIVPFLKFIDSVPSSIRGIITGLLPVVLLAVLMALLPIILRLMAKLGGAPSVSRIELIVQNTYFVFQVVQVFLVGTLGSAAPTVVTAILNKPSAAASLLAKQIPAANHLYISYFILQGLTICAGALLQIVGLILFKVLGKILDSTPRKMYKRWAGLSGLSWGTVFPIYELLIVIAIIYSMIAPLIMGFATIGLYLIYFAYRYNLLFVFNTTIDTKGLVYPRALQHLTVGVYLACVCQIGLFAVATAYGPLVLQIFCLIFLILYHISLNSAVDPLLYSLPKSLEAEEESLLSIEEARAAENTTHETPNGKTGSEPTAIGEKDTVISKGEAPETLPATAGKKPSFFMKFLRPDKYLDYYTLRRLVPKNFAEVIYTPEVERDAYYDPAISSATPLLWIPRDPLGISKQEIAHTSRVIPITDEGASLNEKGKIVIENEDHPPIYEEKVYY